MRFLSRLFAASSQTSRLLRTCHPTPPRPRLQNRFAPLLASRHFHSSMSSSASVLQNGAALETHGNFDLVKRFKLDFADIYVSKWKSRESGLSVVHLDYDGTFLHMYDSLLIFIDHLSHSSSRERVFRRRYRKYVSFPTSLPGFPNIC